MLPAYVSIVLVLLTLLKSSTAVKWLSFQNVTLPALEDTKFSISLKPKLQANDISAVNVTQFDWRLMRSSAFAVEAMYLLTLLPWEGALRENFPVSVGQIAEEIYFQPLMAPDADEQMETQHMVIGLFVGCLNVAAQHHDPGYAITVSTNLRGEQLGLIYIRPRTSDSDAISEHQVNSTPLLLDKHGYPFNATESRPYSVTSNHGSFGDPEERQFQINYRYMGRNTQREPCDIILAAADGVANAAPYSPDAHVARLTGKDGRQRRNALIVVERIARVDPGMKNLTYRYAARAMQLIIRLMKLQDRWQVIEFTLGYGKIRFAEGSITRPRADLEGGNRISASTQ